MALCRWLIIAILSVIGIATAMTALSLLAIDMLLKLSCPREQLLSDIIKARLSQLFRRKENE